jgi:SAM-dependent methyltransferase
MSVFYRLAYALGFRPWEHAATHPPAVQHITRLFEREERGREPPYGRALDLGCGTGHWALVLARRGWQVTGVELVSKAARAARDRVGVAGADVEIVEGDITALRTAGVGDGFRLIWDFGTIHGLSHPQRGLVAREINALATTDASILLLAWSPGRRAPLPRGMSRREIEEAFSGWDVVNDEAFDATGLPPPLRGVGPRAYRLCRKRRSASAA